MVQRHRDPEHEVREEQLSKSDVVVRLVGAGMGEMCVEMVQWTTRCGRNDGSHRSVDFAQLAATAPLQN